MLSKHLLRLTTYIMGVLIISFFILQYFYKENQSLQAKISSLNSNIADLYQDKNPPNQHTLNQFQHKQQTLQTIMSYLDKNINLTTPEKYSTSVVEFRSQFDEKLRQLRLHANRVGVKLGDSLGFSQPLPDTIPEYYWIHLNLGFKVMEDILTMAESQKELSQIVSFNFPDLDKFETNTLTEKFLKYYQIEIILESSYSFTLKVMHNFSQPTQEKNNTPFLSIREANFSMGKQVEDVQSKIRFVGIKINPHGTLEQKIEEKNNPQSTQTTPLWERY